MYTAKLYTMHAVHNQVVHKQHSFVLVQFTKTKQTSHNVMHIILQHHNTRYNCGYEDGSGGNMEFSIGRRKMIIDVIHVLHWERTNFHSCIKINWQRVTMKESRNLTLHPFVQVKELFTQHVQKDENHHGFFHVHWY